MPTATAGARDVRRGPQPIHPDAYVGLVDALLTLVVTRCNAGLLSRAELAAAFAETARQQRESGASDSRRPAVCSISKFLELPLRGDRHLQLIDGGRDRRFLRRSATSCRCGVPTEGEINGEFQRVALVGVRGFEPPAPASRKGRSPRVRRLCLGANGYSIIPPAFTENLR
jgi:hypothetical protein